VASGGERRSGREGKREGRVGGVRGVGGSFQNVVKKNQRLCFNATERPVKRTGPTKKRGVTQAQRRISAHIKCGGMYPLQLSVGNG